MEDSSPSIYQVNNNTAVYENEETILIYLKVMSKSNLKLANSDHVTMGCCNSHKNYIKLHVT